MLLVITSINLFNLIIAELLSSLAFAIKESAEPALLNESIPNSKNKSGIFSKINERGMANWYIINAITTILAGFFYDINPYIPITLSLAVTIFVTLISIKFIEPVQKKENANEFNQFKEIKEAFSFIFKSERLKSLILCSALVTGIIDILYTYQVSLLEELNIDAKYLCIILAIIGIMSGVMAKKQEVFHNKFRNKSLRILLICIGTSILFAGISGIVAVGYKMAVILTVMFFTIWNCSNAIFNPLIEKYLRNFANEEIDTKIFVARNFLGSIMSAIIGIFASFLLERNNTAYSMTIIGIITIIITIMLSKYMKKRVRIDSRPIFKRRIKI